MKYRTTYLKFNTTNKDERTYLNIIKSFGSSAKVFIAYAMLYYYGNSISINYDVSGKKYISVVDTALSEKIISYARDYDKSGISSDISETVFINWHPDNGLESYCINVLSLFKGGAKDFIMDTLKRFYPVIFDNPESLPVLKKKKGTKTGAAHNHKISPAASEPNNSLKSIKEHSEDMVVTQKMDEISDDDFIFPDPRESIDRQLTEIKKRKHIDTSKFE